MRLRSHIASIGLAGCLIAQAAPAAPVVIDFESLAGGTAVIAQFASKGITFKNLPLCMDQSQPGGIPGFAHSGSKTIEICFALEFCTDPIEMTFTAPQRYVKVWAGLSFPPGQTFTVGLRAFNAQGTQVAQATADIAAQSSPVPCNVPLQAEATGQVITRADVTLLSGGQPSFNNGLDVDDVEFDTQGPPPVCTALQAPLPVILSPLPQSTTQIPSFILQGRVDTDAPLESATLTMTFPDGTSTTGDLLASHLVQTIGGPFGPTRFSPIRPGLNHITITVSNCKGSAQTETSVIYSALPPTARVAMNHIEGAQSVQDLSNSVPLISSKRTVVRAYFQTVAPSGLTIFHVGGSMAALLPDGTRPPGPGTIHSFNTVDINSTSPGHQTDLATTMNFELPPEWITAGIVHLEITGLTIDGLPAAIACDACTNTNRFLLPRLIFEDAPPVRVRLLNVPYTVGGFTFMAGATDFDHLESWLRRAYPTGDVEVTRDVLSAMTGTPGIDFSCDDVNARLNGLIDMCNCVSQVHFYGLVSDSQGFMRGCGEISGRVASGPAGATEFSWDTDGSYADWYGGHELAHTYGRKHPGFCNGNSSDDGDYPYPNGKIGGIDYGFDIGDAALGNPMSILPPTDFSDVMTYCDFQWLSDYTYQGILQNLRNIEAGGGGEGGALRDALLVQGTINLTQGTGRLRPCWRMPGLSETPRPASSSFALELRDAGGTALAAYVFDVHPDSEAVAGEDLQASFDLVVPWATGTKRIVALRDGAEFASRNVSAHAPQVKLVSPNGPVTFLPKQVTLPVGWLGSDADGDALTYGIFYSIDAGASWEPLDTGISDHQVDLPLSRLKGTSKGLLRIVASDGVSTGEDVQDTPMALPNRLPLTRIFLPLESAQVFVGEPLILKGEATDLEDGPLTGNSLEWASDRQGVIGHGASLSVSDLQAGAHHLTLSAKDSAGGTGRHAVNVEVLPAPPLADAAVAPLVLVGSTVTLDGSGSSGQGTLVFSWALLSQPAGSKATVKSPQAKVASFVADKAGLYALQLTVTDAGGGVGTALPLTTAAAGIPFIRGEVTGDGQVDISDPVRILNWLFLGDAEPQCRKAADVNDSGTVDVSDAIGLLNFLFTGGARPAAPFPACGIDPTSDQIGCNRNTCR